jgi:hypothetical protein
MMHAEILELLAEQKRIGIRLGKAIKKHLPVGTHVNFTKGLGSINAEITMSSGFDKSLQIKNFKTGKEYWINLYDLLSRKEIDELYKKEREERDGGSK